ncbi:MAG TPA: hypothetical protein VIN40_01605 [Candidatus Tyrphobacter sp.]
MRRLLSLLLATAFFAPASAATLPAAPSPLGALHYRLIGPFRGGRALAVTGVPGEPNHFYFGAVDGGVWETTNAGRTWTPIFDREHVASIGAIAVAPSNHRVLYVGSGEADMRSDIAHGDGMYRSTDGGGTWTHVGLDDTRQVGRILVDPQDANVVYVAALGHQYSPNSQRGVFKSTDGGAHWTKVLYVNDNTGAIDLAMNPRDSQTILAAMWQTRRPPWNVYPPSNGPGSGLYVTHDGGATWAHVTGGLPAHVGHIGLAFSPAAAGRVYADVDSDARHGGIYRSDDAGATWHRTNGQVRLWQRGWYFGNITADPKDPGVVYVMDTSLYRSTDGGNTFVAIKGDPTGDDYHPLWIDPDDSSRMILGSDQGVSVSVDRGKTWSSWYNQPTGQFYHIATDDRFPYWIYGAQQDSGAVAVPSTGRYGSITMLDFHPIDVGGENGYIAADPLHPGMLYGSASNFAGGPVTLENIDTGWERNLDAALAYPGRLWRTTWTLPLAISAADRHSLYYAHQNVFRSRDGGGTWQIISPDLTRPSTPRLPNLDAPTLLDDNGLQRHGVVYALAPSPRAAQTLWAGTDDGLVWLTQDGGTHWRNVTPAAVTAWSKIGIIDASHFDAQTAYVAVDRHRLDDDAPYLYRTHDGGRTWASISRGIPYGDFVNVVREDPFVRGLLYAGTEHGVDVSFDDGNRWQSLQLNLPVTSVRDLAVHGEDLVVGTHGRGIWILDDVSPLRQMAAFSASRASAYLFAPAAAYRIHAVAFEEGTPFPPDEPLAEDAPNGLCIDYVVRDGGGPVEIAILDTRGHVVRSWSSAHPGSAPDPATLTFPPSWAPAAPVPSSEIGAHRFVWDFHTKDDNGPLAPPGRYVVRLTHGGTALTRVATVLRDPRIVASDADLRAQYELALAIEARTAQISAARLRARGMPAILGVAPPPNPDDSEGKPPHDFTNLRELGNAFDNLEQAVESADAAPTPDMHAAYVRLSAMLARTLAKIPR